MTHKIYLIANNKSIQKKFKLPANENDYVVFFNRAILSRYIMNTPSHIFFRAHAHGYWGIENGQIENKDVRALGKEINVGLIGCVHDIEISSPNLLAMSRKNIIIEDIENETKYCADRYPSSGFAAIFHFRKAYPNSQIILVGFNFNNEVVSKCHDWTNERKIIDTLIEKNEIMHYTINSN